MSNVWLLLIKGDCSEIDTAKGGNCSDRGGRGILKNNICCLSSLV